MGVSGEAVMRVVLFAVAGCLAMGCAAKESDSGETPDQNRDTASPVTTAPDTGDDPPLDTASDSGLDDTAAGDTAAARTAGARAEEPTRAR